MSVTVVPKEHTIFKCEVPRDDDERVSSQTPNGKPVEVQNFVFELHGSQFAQRPAQRSSRQIKLHIMPDI
jgi:ribonuclease P protein subunit POP4